MAAFAPPPPHSLQEIAATGDIHILGSLSTTKVLASPKAAYIIPFIKVTYI